MPLGSDRDWQEEWQQLLRQRDTALARSRALQAEISAVFRRRQPPPMELMRAAEQAEGDIAAVKERLRELLRRVGRF